MRQGESVAVKVKKEKEKEAEMKVAEVHPGDRVGTLAKMKEEV